MITYTSTKSIEALLKDLEKATQENGFSVLSTHDLKAKMVAKGFSFEHPCLIVEVCNPAIAKTVLEADLSISTALPCRISVYQTGDQTTLATLEPTTMISAFNQPKLQPIAEQVEQTLKRIMSKAVAQ